MKLTCRYSNIEWHVANCFGDIPGKKTTIIQTHPVFHLPIKTLLAQMGKWSASFDLNNKSPMSETERKLLFLALLHATGLLHWRVPARLHIDIADKYMEKLARFMNYFEAIRAPEKVLPQFVIDHATRDLDNVGIWIEAWGNALGQWKQGYETAIILQKLEARERALSKLINSPLTKNASDKTRYTNQLAAWALAVTVPIPAAFESRKEYEISLKAFEATKEYWISLFSLRGMEIYSARTADLEEMQDWLVQNMPEASQGTIYAHAVMRHVNMLVAINRKGLNHGLGIPDADDIDPEELLAMEAKPFNILPDDEVEDHNASLAALQAPMREPIRANYNSTMEYLQAKAAFVLAKKQLNKILLAEQREANAAAKEAIEAIDAAEDSEGSDEPVSLRDI